VQKFEQVVELVDPVRKDREVSNIRSQLRALCGAHGAPYGDYANCLQILDRIQAAKPNTNDVALKSV
jgi:hypothetical protein